jgi:DNA polymerase (family 10)
MGRSYESAERTPVDNAQVARVLTEIRTLMEFAGEPYFKFMAYERAASAVQNAPPVGDLIVTGELLKLPGVGKTIGARIIELVQTGHSAYHEELLAKYPPSLFEVLGVQGVGMKTAQALFEQYGIASLAELERAIDSDALAGAPRLGRKTLENMKRGILAYKGRQQRTPIGTALPLAREIIAYVAGGAPVANITYAGSLRRQEVTVGDIDIVCTSDEPEAVISRFVSWERAEAVLAEGSTKASIWLAGGLQIDLRVLQDDVYGNLLQHFTGSREHNIQLRELAVRKGLRVSENGILNVATLENQTFRTEADVYAALGLAYIPPEMRLGMGEVEAAMDGTLPQPIELSDLRGDFHMHCTWSDGVDSLEAMIAAAAARGYEYHSISDHSWGRGATYGLDPNVLRSQRARVRELGERYNLRTLCASEVDILPDGSLDYDDDVLEGLDLVIASVHSSFQQSREEMTARLIRACENPYVTIIGHPTGRNVGGFGGYAFDADALFAAAARTGTALEIDGQPSRLDLPSALARRARSFGVTFSIDSDAHAVDQLENVAFGVGQARRAWVTRQEVLNARPLEDVLTFVRQKRLARQEAV